MAHIPWWLSQSEPQNCIIQWFSFYNNMYSINITLFSCLTIVLTNFNSAQWSWCKSCLVLVDSLFQAFSVNAFESDLSDMNSFTNWVGPNHLKCMGCPIWRLRQFSPYQAVTGKFYRLRWHFLPPATARKFTKIQFLVLKNTQVVIQSNEFSQGNKWIYRKVII